MRTVTDKTGMEVINPFPFFFSPKLMGNYKIPFQKPDASDVDSLGFFATPFSYFSELTNC